MQNMEMVLMRSSNKEDDINPEKEERAGAVLCPPVL